MRTVEIFEFNELTEEAKRIAIDQWHKSPAYYESNWAYENTKEDADNVGLKIDYLEEDQAGINRGSFEVSAPDTAQRITTEHGNQFDTYKTAKKFLSDLEQLTGKYENIQEVPEEEIDKLENEFLADILRRYAEMYKRAKIYEGGDEHAAEELREEEFFETGKIYKA